MMRRQLLKWAKDGASAYGSTLMGFLYGLVSGGIAWGLVALAVGGSIYLLQPRGLLLSIDPVAIGMVAGTLPGLVAFGYAFGWIQMPKLETPHLRRWATGSAIAGGVITPIWLWIATRSGAEAILNLSDTLQVAYWLALVVLWSMAQVLSVRLPFVTALRFGFGNAATFGGIVYLLSTINQPPHPFGGGVSMALIALGWVLVGAEHNAIYEKLHPGKSQKGKEKSKGMPKKKGDLS